MDNFPNPFPKHSTDAWRVFRILGEFVEGFETMTNIGPSIAFFGSTVTKPDDPYYRLATELAARFVKQGFAIITGGGPGIMEAANKGAQEAKGSSCGLCIDLPMEEAPNLFIDRKYFLHFHYFFVRKVMFVRYARAFIAFPGAYGTLDELFESLTLISTKRIQPFPVYLVGTKYWSGLLDWIKTTLVASGNLSEENFNLIKVTDDIDEILKSIVLYCDSKGCFENF